MLGVMGGVGGEKYVRSTFSNQGRISKSCLLQLGSLEHLQSDKSENARLPDGETTPAGFSSGSRCLLRSGNEAVTGPLGENGFLRAGGLGLGRGRPL